jgi:hypothetical protein
MGKINLQRVFLGGLLAGLVFNVFEGVAGALGMNQIYRDAMTALGKSMTMSGGLMAYYLVLGFVWGIFAVWLYAAIRPRFGAGVKTAVIAGLALWFAWPLMHWAGYGPMGLFPTKLHVVFAAYGLVEMPLMTVVGAWLYKEGAAM